MSKKPKLTPTGRMTQQEPQLQNIPIKTEEGRKIRDSFFKPSLGVPFSHFAEQEARAHEIVRDTDIMAKMLEGLPPGARVVSQVHDEIEIDFSQVEEELTLKYLAGRYLGGSLRDFGDLKVDVELGETWPPLEPKDKEEMMRMAYGGGHHHVTTECSGRCSYCGKQIHDSHETRIEKLEQRVIEMENNLRELAGVKRQP